MRRGFTLMELLVVIVLLTIVSTFAVTAFATRSAPSAPDRGQAMLQRARQMAITTNQPITVCDSVIRGELLCAVLLPDGRIVSTQPGPWDPLAGTPTP